MSSGAMDFGYLESVAAGDRRVVVEVLETFLGEARGWAQGLDGSRQGSPDLLHTMKGAGRGIGARVLGDACERAENLGDGEMTQVRAALAAAVADIEAYLDRSSSQTSNS